MAETTYTAVTWTAGDTITEAKLDNMVANDQAVDAHAQGIELTERTAPSTPSANRVHIYAKDDSSVTRVYGKSADGNEVILWPSRTMFILPATGSFYSAASNLPEQKVNQGTNKADITLDYDASSDETDEWSVPLPPSIVINKATLYVFYRMASATSGAVIWAAIHNTRADSEAWDTAGTTDTFSADTVPGTAGMVAVTSKALTVTGWAASESLHIKISRDADNAGDTATGDAKFMHALLILE